MSGPPAWRLIVDRPAAGAWNMAIDEALLESAASGEAPPTLRLYGFQPAALSLGANQPLVGDRAWLRAQGIHLVRRPTGGLAVLHEGERTYSVSGPLRSATFPGGVLDTYRRIAEALVIALRRLGIDGVLGVAARTPGRARPGTAACFGLTSAHEIAVGGRKLIGSAQLRRRGGFLQHGSIPIVGRPERLARALGGGIGAPATDLAGARGGPVSSDELDAALVHGFRERFGTTWSRSSLSEAERVRATRLYSWKYLSGSWTLDGRRVSHRCGSAPPVRDPATG